MSIASLNHPPLILWNNEQIDIPKGLHLDKEACDNSCMKVITKLDGDYEINYDKNDPIQVSAAKIMFDRMTANGMTAYKVKKVGKDDPADKKAEKGAKMKEFDEKVDHIIFMPLEAQVGG